MTESQNTDKAFNSCDWDSIPFFSFETRFSPLGQRILVASKLLDGVWALQFRKFFCFAGSGGFRPSSDLTFPSYAAFKHDVVT